MDISTGLIAKGTAGALAASAAVGGGVWAGTNGMFNGLFRSNVVENEGIAQSTLDVQNDSSHQTQQETAVNSNNENEQGETGPKETVSPSPKIEGPTVDVSSEDRSSRDLTTTVQNLGNDQVEGASETGQQTKITKWDEALINYLKGERENDRDIAFEIKTGNKTKVELSNVFPDFEASDDQNSGKKTTITISVSTSTNDLKGTDSDAKITELKNMNGGEATGKKWTWKCKVILLKNATDSDEFTDKEKLIGDNGYFNRLKKLVSNESEETNKKNLRELKAKFIENCANSRDDAKAKEYREATTSLNNDKIIAEKVFRLQKKSGTGLEIKQDQKNDFNTWFLTTPIQSQ